MFDLILDVTNGFSAKIGSIVPLGPGYFSHHPRHFVPGPQALRAWLLSCCPSAMIKHQSQRGELLPNGGQNGSKNKRNNFPAGLDKVGGFIEAPFNPERLFCEQWPPFQDTLTKTMELELNWARESVEHVGAMGYLTEVK